MHHAEDEKWKKTNNGRIELSNQGRMRPLGQRENDKYLEKLKVETIKQEERKEKKVKNTKNERENISKLISVAGIV